MLYIKKNTYNLLIFFFSNPLQARVALVAILTFFHFLFVIPFSGKQLTMPFFKLFLASLPKTFRRFMAKISK